MGVYLYTPRAGKKFKAFDQLSKHMVTVFPMEFAWKYCQSWSSQVYYKEDFHLARIHNAAWRAVNSPAFEGLVAMHGENDGSPVVALNTINGTVTQCGWEDCLDYPGTVIGYLHKTRTGWTIIDAH